MGFLVCTGATLQCSFGAAPSTLIVLPRPILSPMPIANIMDHVPFLNILPFGMCSTISNPAVASSTAAACGVLTPVPCIPVIPSPWLIGNPKILVENLPALTSESKLMCAWGGIIQIINPGQFKIQAS